MKALLHHLAAPALRWLLAALDDVPTRWANETGDGDE